MTTNFFLTTLFSDADFKPIKAFFKDGSTMECTMDIFNLLITDAEIDCITDGKTGEIIFIK
jgi:hypothetical protein